MPYPSSHHYDDTFEPDDSSNSSFVFASQPQHSLYPMSDYDPPQSWPPYDQTLLPPFQSQQQVLYHGFPAPASYATPRLSSPNTAGGGQVTTNVSRLTLAGSLDPTTGIFYRTPEHPRLRTAQACEKCRTRKAKCSGEHPSCKRCINRGLVCEYAKEGRVRGPNKAKNSMSLGGSSAKNVNISTDVDPEQPSERTSSATSSIGSAGQSVTSTQASPSVSTTRDPSHPPILCEERSPPTPSSATSLNTHGIPSPSRLNFTPLSHHPPPQTVRLSQDIYSLPVSDNISPETSSRHNSLNLVGSVGLGEHRASRSRPPNLSIDATGHWRPGGIIDGGHHTGWNSQPKGLDLNDLAAELPTDFQDNQRQYERQCLMRQQHQRFLSEQQAFVALQQDHMRSQSQSAPTGLEYQDLRRQSSSLSGMITAPSLPRVSGSALSPVFQTQYQMHTPPEDYRFQRVIESSQGLTEMPFPAYPEESQIASVITHKESYQRATTSHGSTEQGLRPLLSRIEKRLDSLPDSGGGHLTGTCPSNISHGQGAMNDNVDPTGWM